MVGKQSSGVYRIYTPRVESLKLFLVQHASAIIYFYIIGVYDSIYSVFHPMKCVESDVMWYKLECQDINHYTEW